MNKVYFIFFLLSVSLVGAKNVAGTQEIAANSSVAWRFMSGEVLVNYIVNVTSSWGENVSNVQADIYILDSINHARLLAGENFTYYKDVSCLNFIWVWEPNASVNIDTQETFVLIKPVNLSFPITINYDITIIHTGKSEESLRSLPSSIAIIAIIFAIFIIIAIVVFLARRRHRLMQLGYHYIE